MVEAEKLATQMEGTLLGDNHLDWGHWLCVCAGELWRETGEYYTPRSLSQFIVALHCYISAEKEFPGDHNSPIVPAITPSARQPLFKLACQGHQDKA